MNVAKAQNQNRIYDIFELRIYIEGIIWSAGKLNLSYVQEFSDLINRYFGKIAYADLRKYNNVEDKLKSYFASVEPT